MNRPATLVLVLLLAACGASSTPTQALFKVNPSVQQVQITHAPPGTSLSLRDATGKTVQSGTADTLGSLIFRDVAPGSGYSVLATTLYPPAPVGPLTVESVSGSLPPRSFYTAQTLQSGFGYIKTRDGTKLSIFVTMPGPADKGPYPTVVNYSGYSPSEPGTPDPSLSALCTSFPTLCAPPSDPSAEIIGLMGYATVGVNMRGTGCSGGAYDFFDTLQLLDGYDIIETVAAQSWVLHNKVGMTGISYPGFSQFYVAETQPPSLAAITPFSVIGNPFQTMEPGGLLNTGFAVEWAQSVTDGAAPYGQGWEQGMVNKGDLVCKENQLLHGQKIDVVQEIKQNPYYRADLGDPINPLDFVQKIEVPVFLASAWQDEQTGPFFTPLLNRFTSSKLTRFTVHNGVHVDSFAPAIMAEWKNFLDLYVAQQIPSMSSTVAALSPELFEQIFSTSMSFPPNRFAGATSYEQALSTYQAEPVLRVLFESGAGSTTPGAPVHTFERSFSQWPVPSTVPLRLYFQPDGTLKLSQPAATPSASSFKLDPSAGSRLYLAQGGNVWDLLPKYDYQELKPGYAVTFLSDPIETLVGLLGTNPAAQDVVMLGDASVDLYVQSDQADADLQVTLTEVRPDGQEMYVQSGWLRASERALATDATVLWPDHTFLQPDAAPLPAGQWSLVRVELAAFGHVFRVGSRIRITVDTPGGTRAVWQFQLKTFTGDVTHKIAHFAAYPSSVVLPVIPDVHATDTKGNEIPLPACPSLRGQPCRTYQQMANTPAQ